MARLKQLGARLPSQKSRLKSGAERMDGESRSAFRRRIEPRRQWYSTSAWQRLRWQCLERDLFTCRKCGRIEADTSQLTADHIVPHRFDEALFWDADNLQTLCKSCHDSVKQAEERAGIWG